MNEVVDLESLNSVPRIASDTPLISIVIPTYNEEKDIARTMESLLSQRYQNKEIIVVDDSTDATPRILNDFIPRGIQVIREMHEGGRCGARNLGIRRAHGAIIVILNADVSPEPDFLDQILPHYQNGADFVIVENRVANVDCFLPRYIDADHKANVDIFQYAWTEGFSCRREAALEVGLFPVDTPLPYIGGEDMIFAEKLGARYRKAVDPSIVVAHHFPETVREFYLNRWQRGWGVPVFKFFCLRKSLLIIIGVASARTAVRVCSFAFVLPHLWLAWKFSRFSARKTRDLLPFAVAVAIERVAFTIGEWAGVIAVLKRRNAPIRGAT